MHTHIALNLIIKIGLKYLNKRTLIEYAAHKIMQVMCMNVSYLAQGYFRSFTSLATVYCLWWMHSSETFHFIQ